MGIQEGTVLQVGAGAGGQLVTVGSVPALTFVAPDPGNVTVFPGLSREWPSGTPVSVIRSMAPIAGRQATVLALPTTTGATDLFVTDGNAFAASEMVRLTSGEGVTFHTLLANGTPLTGGAANAADRPLMVTLQSALVRAQTPRPSGWRRHPASSPGRSWSCSTRAGPSATRSRCRT